ncbi:hypothetical protein HAX54_044588 [Datura stramonium]|uniref:Uncharacterized protein n=1 Tax=Datura stramonium TaxID=4076 RepID=A0ABS8WEV1_DATST|nr:hypothetical protein [Datura stramonium]
MPDYEGNGEDIDNYGSSPISTRGSHVGISPSQKVFPMTKCLRFRQNPEANRLESPLQTLSSSLFAPAFYITYLPNLKKKGPTRGYGARIEKGCEDRTDEETETGTRKGEGGPEDRDDDERHRTQIMTSKEIMTKIERVGIDTGLAQGRSEHNQGLDRARSKSKRISGFDMAPPTTAMLPGTDAAERKICFIIMLYVQGRTNTGQVPGTNSVIPGMLNMFLSIHCLELFLLCASPGNDSRLLGMLDEFMSVDFLLLQMNSLLRPSLVMLCLQLEEIQLVQGMLLSMSI